MKKLSKDGKYLEHSYNGKKFRTRIFTESDSDEDKKAWSAANPGGLCIEPISKMPKECIHEEKGVPCHCTTPGADAVRHAYRLGFFAKRAVRVTRRDKQWLKFATKLFALKDSRKPTTLP